MQSRITLLILFYSQIACFGQIGSDLNKLLPSNNGDVIIHNNFTLSYLYECKQSEWVIYKLTDQMFINNNSCKRPNYFKKDPLIVKQNAVNDDYRNSNYDKGHLVPAFDMKFSCTAYKETFIMSNVTPQKHAFNAGIWYDLENKIRDWANEKGELYIITGPALLDTNKTIGKNNICIPSYFYKIILDVSDTNVIAFLFEHENNTQNINDCIVSIDSLETITNINFFYKLEDKFKDLESQIHKENWFE
jgi:endonuclease G, mitochondrial